ncbi:hypothetical protein LZ3411_1184 [Levilactobacillus zymae]|uniref:Uncharacterized protein n=1 Tax=Levilactobacillus zymae TaxID=267363 RepID=A0A1Y6K100_9LACO|nr:hypothetical protein LZ3411_1184 [Levilactobacillus zymae]
MLLIAIADLVVAESELLADAVSALACMAENPLNVAKVAVAIKIKLLW